MSVDGSMYRHCDACDSLAFDPSACGECTNTRQPKAFCEAHRHECANCGETTCPDHARRATVDGEPVLVCVECAKDLENKEQGQAERAFERSLNADNGPSDAGYRAAMKDAGRGHLLP